MAFTSTFCTEGVSSIPVFFQFSSSPHTALALNRPFASYIEAKTSNAMVEKRKRDIALLEAESDTTTNSMPRKKRRKQNTRADFTIDEIRAFKDGISKIKDWTSNIVIKKHVQIIYWFDVENLSKDECAKRYPNKNGQPCSLTNIFKVYNTYAPRFYAEKGLEYIPLGKRVSARAAPILKKKKGKKLKKDRRNPMDVRLEELFRDLPDLARLTPWRSVPSCLHDTTMIEYHHDLKTDAVAFLCRVGSTTFGSPCSIQIPRAHLLRHCTSIRESLLENPRIATITHGPEISAETICRFAACINEPLETCLPDTVTTAYGTFEQEWNPTELEDLYVLAVSLGAGVVCDMVINRWVEELRRPDPRVVVDEFGEVRYFDILDFGPELLTFLWPNDRRGFAFFFNVLFSQRMRGFERMRKTHLANWHEDVKRILIRTLEEGRVIDLSFAPGESICAAFHHHSPKDCERRLPEKIPEPKTRATAAPKTSARPTLNPRRARYDDSKEDTSHILRLTIPPFAHTYNKQPQISPIELDPIYALAQRSTDRQREHRNDHFNKRIQYANDRFNAHHDSGDVCYEKLRMCRETIALFQAHGIEISDEEVEEAVVEQERTHGEDGGESQDEEGDVEDESEEEEFYDV
ncbi:uncharacterized protein M421DRAFT_185354 [Didymella exigua CBS 183.55]|uniref:Uncharacterized protein n=1 Tax=Didymella exigua CBS 183.55 TaxID=1150837 RepID=A0A6A5RFY1_9PLEO|nr:uncharacterized protein M421DRAFT_185354 [Didymella exigua CBS 183.55]KAF1927221.1 hypothetical protein M421DRAFT_185354 [Didymella exigua CBS 183.55]